jgi:hypothetical protein
MRIGVPDKPDKAGQDRTSRTSDLVGAVGFSEARSNFGNPLFPLHVECD